MPRKKHRKQLLYASKFCARVAVLVSLVSVVSGCKTIPVKSSADNQSEWVNLLNEDLSHFDRYLSYAFEPGYDGNQPVDEKNQPISPIGLNPTGYGVFKMLTESDTPILRVSGEYYGSLTTKKSYRNYHLQVNFRWGEEVHDPRKEMLKDTGILYHARGAHGEEYWRSWKMSQEFQIMEGHVGDYWSLGDTAIDIRAYPREYIMSPVASLNRPFIAVGTNQSEKGYVMRRGNYEFEQGWNRLELITWEGKSLHVVNGEVAMVLQNSRYYRKGVEQPLVEGQIQIQSEAAEVFFKDIKIREINALPEAYTSLFE